MTELEKKAEQYALDSGYEKGKPDFWTVTQAYIAGAKANDAQWHDIRKDPNDLPKEFDIIRKAFGVHPEEKHIHIVVNQIGEYVHYMYGNWYYVHEEDMIGCCPKADVIAWREIPQLVYNEKDF